MASAALYSLIQTPNPNPNPSPILFRNGPLLARPHYSPLSRPIAALALRRLDLDLALASPLKCRINPRLISVGRRARNLLPLASPLDEPKSSDVEIENEKPSDIEPKEEASEAQQEAWKQTLESFKEEALKLKGVSEEAYEAYSKKAWVILQETSEKLKIQAEKTSQDLTVLAKELGEEGKEYLATAAKNSPDEVRDIVETFAAADELTHISAVRDFYVGIPYGAFLALGGFLSFMLTGSITAIRFGVILGAALLALSVWSLRAWKRKEEASELLLDGQAGIATILFIREFRLFSQRQSFPSLLTTLISGAVFAFYIYRILKDDSSKGPSAEQGSE